MFIMIRVWAGHLRVLGSFHYRGKRFSLFYIVNIEDSGLQMLHHVVGYLNCMLHSVTSQKTRILRFFLHQFVHTVSATEPPLGAVGTEGSFPWK